ncbi:MAG: prolipoprotein diacylglyceryl transferase [candidate division NC10 bacterium]|nr:prolipoprotein diacylglyceryl transferase [candidate division NC10 bacterium]
MFSSPGAIALQFGPLAVRWYGVLIATGVLLGTTLAHREAIRRGQDPDKLLNAIVLTVLVALLGARLYYVLFNWDYYGANPSRILAVWEGGLAIHGGLIAGAVATVLYCRHARLPLTVTTDIMVPGVAIGQAIGRWGNFFNQEAFGVPTYLPWKLYIDPAHRPPHLAGYEYFHPTFLYESLWNLLVFALLWFGLRKRLQGRPGALTLCYLGLYSMGRFFVEGLRIDSLMLGSLRAAQVVSFLLVVASGLGLLLVARRK